MIKSLHKIHFSTYSRDDAITASTTLVSGIKSQRLSTKKTKILIVGVEGKSLIVDAIARHLSDHHTADNMPSERFVEGRPLASMDRKEKKHISYQNQDCVISLSHIFDPSPFIFRERKSGWLSNLMNTVSKPRHESIEFLTTPHPYTIKSAIMDGHYAPDITIQFYPTKDYSPDYPYYDDDVFPCLKRYWTITIHNPELLTEDMAGALRKLETPNAFMPLQNPVLASNDIHHPL